MADGDDDQNQNPVRGPTPEYLQEGNAGDGLQEDGLDTDNEDEDDKRIEDERRPRSEAYRKNHPEFAGYLGAEPRKGFTGPATNVRQKDIIFCVLLWDDRKLKRYKCLHRINWTTARTTFKFCFNFANEELQNLRSKYDTARAARAAQYATQELFDVAEVVDFYLHMHSGPADAHGRRVKRIDYLTKFNDEPEWDTDEERWMQGWIYSHNTLWRGDCKFNTLVYWSKQAAAIRPAFLRARVLQLPDAATFEYRRDNGIPSDLSPMVGALTGHRPKRNDFQDTPTGFCAMCGDATANIVQCQICGRPFCHSRGHSVGCARITAPNINKIFAETGTFRCPPCYKDAKLRVPYWHGSQDLWRQPPFVLPPIFLLLVRCQGARMDPVRNSGPDMLKNMIMHVYRGDLAGRRCIYEVSVTGKKMQTKVDNAPYKRFDADALKQAALAFRYKHSWQAMFLFAIDTHAVDETGQLEFGTTLMSYNEVQETILPKFAPRRVFSTSLCIILCCYGLVTAGRTALMRSITRFHHAIAFRAPHFDPQLTTTEFLAPFTRAYVFHMNSLEDAVFQTVAYPWFTSHDVYIVSSHTILRRYTNGALSQNFTGNPDDQACNMCGANMVLQGRPDKDGYTPFRCINHPTCRAWRKIRFRDIPGVVHAHSPENPRRPRVLVIDCQGDNHTPAPNQHRKKEGRSAEKVKEVEDGEDGEDGERSRPHRKRTWMDVSW